jgi:2-haloacid dehalogenase
MNSFDPFSVKAMVFDVFGTVVDWRGSIIAEGRNYWQPEKGIDIDWEDFADSWRRGYGPSMNRVRTGELPWTLLDGLHRMMLDDLLPQFGITSLSEEDIDYLNRVWHRLNGWPDSPPGLARLKARYLLSTLSNGNVALLTNMAKFAGLPWDCILGSDIFHHFKPDPEMYLGAADILGLHPEQVMMVAAHPFDLDAASKYGLRTGYVHRPLERGPNAAHAAPPAPGTYDVIASDFRDMASQLGL